MANEDTLVARRISFNFLSLIRGVRILQISYTIYVNCSAGVSVSINLGRIKCVNRYISTLGCNEVMDEEKKKKKQE